MMEKGRMLRGFMVFCGSLEIMLFGGVIFGWASLVYVYKHEGYFSHLCPAENRSLLHNLTTSAMSKPGDYYALTRRLELNKSFSGNLTEDDGSNMNRGGDLGPSMCKEQDHQFNLIFTIATVFTGIMCFVNGLIYDKLGTRFCRTVAIVCFLGAMACLYFASPELPELLYPGATLLVYGGYLILITNLQLANLVPTYRSTIMSLYAGSYDCSAAMLLVFKAAYEGGVSVNTCFLVQACAFTVLVCTSTFCTLPKYHLPWPLPEDFHINPPIQRLCRRAGDVVHNQEVEVEPAADEDWEAEQKRLNVETDSTNPKRSHLSIPGINIDTESVSNSSRPASVKTARAFNNSRFLAADISTSECLLAINHVPRLSTASINRSIQKHSGRTPNLARAVLMRRSAERGAGLGAGQHHLSLLNIPGGQRSLLHRGSVSMDNVTLALPRPSAQEGSLAINHVPQLSTASLSVPHSSPANSVFRSMNSVGGISEIRPAPDESFLDAPMGDDSPLEKPTSFREEVLSPLFLVEVMWMSFQRLRSWFFVGVFNPWITALADGHRPTISYYTSVFAAMQFFGIFTAPLNGRLMDRKPGEKYNYKSVKFERLHASIPSFALNSTVVLLLSIGAAIPVIEVQYVTFALHVLNRSFTYGPNSAFIANAFPFQYFGILLGTSLTLSAIFGMLQYPLFLLIHGPLNNDPKMVNIALIVLMTLTYVHPIYIWIYLQRKLKKRAKLAAGECTEPLNKGKGDNSGVNDKATTNNAVDDTAISSTEVNKDSGIDDSGDTNNLAGANDDESPKMSAAETMEKKAGGLDVPSINSRDNISQSSQENTYL